MGTICKVPHPHNSIPLLADSTSFKITTSHFEKHVTHIHTRDTRANAVVVEIWKGVAVGVKGVDRLVELVARVLVRATVQRLVVCRVGLPTNNVRHSCVTMGSSLQ